MNQPQPIIVTPLFPEILKELLNLLSNLSAEEWNKPTVCSGWSVQDVALHLLGGDVGILSRKRDNHLLAGDPIQSWDELVGLINYLNDIWVKATRRISPRLLRDLLELTGTQVCDYFETLDPYAMGEPVDWAGPEAAPVWLDLAREYTERWHHQQHIRDAVGKPGLKQPRFFAPILDAFIRALPYTFREVEAASGTLVAVEISGDAGDKWFLLKEENLWNLYLNMDQQPQAEVVIDQDIAWRLFTKGINRQDVLTQITISGERSLGLKVIDMVSIIA